MILINTCILLFFGYFVLLLLYKLGWQRQNILNPNTRNKSEIFVTIVIPARNEADNIGKCLRSILANNYPKTLMEIIVIDDFSEDDTAVIASKLLQNENGYVLQLQSVLSKDERINSYKKKALEIAIGKAKGDWIITTDADCEVPENWISQLFKFADDQTHFIAAPVSFTPPHSKKDLLYYFQSLDFMTMQGITAASIHMNLGNMCNGANLAFKKSTFNEIGGYQGIDQIASGDDMLLMHKIQVRYPKGIRYIKSAEAIVHTPAQPSWNQFLNQRIRWSSKADKYNEKRLTLILALVYFYNVSFLVLSIAGFFNSTYWLFLLGMLFAKTIIELFFLFPVARFYRKQKELLFFPFLQPLHILYIILAGFLGKFGSYQWKGRTVK